MPGEPEMGGWGVDLNQPEGTVDTGRVGEGTRRVYNTREVKVSNAGSRTSVGKTKQNSERKLLTFQQRRSEKRQGGAINRRGRQGAAPQPTEMHNTKAPSENGSQEILRPCSKMEENNILSD